MITARAPVRTRLRVLMTGMLSSCAALFQICAEEGPSLSDNGFMGTTSLFVSPSIALTVMKSDVVDP